MKSINQHAQGEGIFLLISFRKRSLLLTSEEASWEEAPVNNLEEAEDADESGNIEETDDTDEADDKSVFIMVNPLSIAGLGDNGRDL